MVNRSRYSREFRTAVANRVAALRDEGRRRTVSAVADQTGLPAGTVRRWYHEFAPAEPASPATSGATVPEQRLPLVGLAHHDRCGKPLRAGQGADGHAAYTCPSCRPPRILDAEQVHQHAVGAVARQAPRLGRLSPTRLPDLLLSLRVNDQCRTTALAWRPRPTQRA